VEAIIIDPIDDTPAVSSEPPVPSAPVASSSDDGAGAVESHVDGDGEEEEVVENQRVVPVVDGVAEAEMLDSANSRLGFEYAMETPLWYHWTMWAVPALLGALLELVAMGIYGGYEPCFSYMSFSTFQRKAVYSPWWSVRGVAQHTVRGHFLMYALRTFADRWILSFYHYVAWNGGVCLAPWVRISISTAVFDMIGFFLIDLFVLLLFFRPRVVKFVGRLTGKVLQDGNAKQTSYHFEETKPTAVPTQLLEASIEASGSFMERRSVQLLVIDPRAVESVVAHTNPTVDMTKDTLTSLHSYLARNARARPEIVWSSKTQHDTLVYSTYLLASRQQRVSLLLSPFKDTFFPGISRWLPKVFFGEAVPVWGSFR